MCIRDRHKENNANREAFLLSRTLYINGQTDFLNVITAQRSWLSSEAVSYTHLDVYKRQSG